MGNALRRGSKTAICVHRPIYLHHRPTRVSYIRLCRSQTVSEETADNEIGRQNTIAAYTHTHIKPR